MPSVEHGVPASLSLKGTIEAAARFERATITAERRGPSPNVHPRLHQAMIEAMRSVLAELHEQIAAGRPTT